MNIKKYIKSMILNVGILEIYKVLMTLFFGHEVLIIFGHRVLKDEILQDKNNMNTIVGHTSVSEVEQLIKYLSKEYSFISISDAVEQINSRKILKKSIVLTFDDGFQDNYINLLPILKKYNVPATLYLNTSVVGTKKSIWFQSIINYFFKINDDKIFISFNNTNYDLSTPQARFDSAFSFMRYLQSNFDPSSFDQIIKDVTCGLNLPESEDLHLTWDEVKELVKEPLITIGAHSVNHYPLTLCADSMALKEIEGSKRHLEAMLGTEILHFSFPRGQDVDFNDGHIEHIKKIGFISSCTTISGVNRRGDDCFRLKRIGLPQRICGMEEELDWYYSGISQTFRRIKFF